MFAILTHAALNIFGRQCRTHNHIKIAVTFDITVRHARTTTLNRPLLLPL